MIKYIFILSVFTSVAFGSESNLEKEHPLKRKYDQIEECKYEGLTDNQKKIQEKIEKLLKENNDLEEGVKPLKKIAGIQSFEDIKKHLYEKDIAIFLNFTSICFGDLAFIKELSTRAIKFSEKKVNSNKTKIKDLENKFKNDEVESDEDEISVDSNVGSESDEDNIIVDEDDIDLN